MVWGLHEMDDVFFGVANGQFVGFWLAVEVFIIPVARVKRNLSFVYVLVFTHDKKLSFGEFLELY